MNQCDSQQLKPHSFIVGLDIASQSFTARLLHLGEPEGAVQEFANRPAGYQELERWLNQRGALPAESHVIMEATGVYWEECALYVHAKGYRVNVVNPAQIKGFARTTLRRAKTDATDADLIARFGRSVPLPAWEPPPLELEALQLIMRQREAYLAMLTQEKNRLHALERRPQPPPNLVRTTKKTIAYMERCIREMEDSFKDDLRQYPQWQKSVDLLQTIPGVGPITSATVLTETRALASFLESRQLTAYAGVAPAPHTSGSSIYHRASISKIGNPRLRRTVYMAALSAARVSGPLQDFYLRLRQRGKAPKVALTALARKLLVLCFVIVRSQRPFDPSFVSAR
jgi:transposase